MVIIINIILMTVIVTLLYNNIDNISKEILRTSLVVQWLRIRLSTHGTWVQYLVRKITVASGQLRPHATTTEPEL